MHSFTILILFDIGFRGNKLLSKRSQIILRFAGVIRRTVTYTRPNFCGHSPAAKQFSRCFMEQSAAIDVRSPRGVGTHFIPEITFCCPHRPFGCPAAGLVTQHVRSDGGSGQKPGTRRQADRTELAGLGLQQQLWSLLRCGCLRVCGTWGSCNNRPASSCVSY